MKRHFRYILSFHFHWLTPWYDPMMRLLFPEEELKTALIAQAHIQPGQNVLDMGCCGTGTLTLMIKQTQPYTLWERAGVRGGQGAPTFINWGVDAAMYVSLAID